MKSRSTYLNASRGALILCVAVLLVGCASDQAQDGDMKDRVSGLSGAFTVDFSKSERNDLRGTITSRAGEEVPFCVVVASGDPSPAKCKRMNLHMECEGIDVFANAKEISPKESQEETRKALQIPNALTDAVFGPEGYRDCAK